MSIVTEPENEYTKLVKATIFNYLTGVDPEGNRIHFGNDCSTGKEVAKVPKHVTNIDELIKHGVKSLKECIDKLISITPMPDKFTCVSEECRNKTHYFLTYDRNEDSEFVKLNKKYNSVFEWCYGECKDLKIMYKHMLEEFIEETSVAYNLCYEIIPTYYNFGGDSNANVYFESDIIKFIITKIEEFQAQ